MSFSIPINYIRQWCFCPRIVYYIELTNYDMRYPTWVKQGEKFHIDQAKHWQRRNLSRFKITEGKIHLDYNSMSDSLGIHGIADMVVETDDFIYPVEFKLDSSIYKKGAILQLVAYALIAKESFNKKCTTGFIAEGDKHLHEIRITNDLKEEVLDKVYKIKNMINIGNKPDSSATEVQCSNCEFLNHCNDRC